MIKIGQVDFIVNTYVTRNTQTVCFKLNYQPNKQKPTHIQQKRLKTYI